MRASLLALRNVVLGLGLALAIAALVPNTAVSASGTCCTQCSCVQLCCSSDECSGGGNQDCDSGGCSWWCYSPMWVESYRCENYCF